MLLTAALDHRVETIWIARDLGYRGGRRTGVPLTDEIHLGHAGTLMGGIAFERATQGPAVAERTAAIVWRVRADRSARHALNARSIPMKRMIRCRTDATREASARHLPIQASCQIRPRQIVAIGRDAHLALDGLDIPTTAVRHPSYGGQREFIEGMFSLYGVADDNDEPLELPLGAPHAAARRCALA